jgi:hypothetical protein
MGKNGKKKRRKALAAYFQLCQLFGNSVWLAINSLPFALSRKISLNHSSLTRLSGVCTHNSHCLLIGFWHSIWSNFNLD